MARQVIDHVVLLPVYTFTHFLPSLLSLPLPPSLLPFSLPPSLLRVGTGKTLLARAVAKQLDANFLKVVSSAIVDKYIGESARLIREMFGT